MNKIDKKLFKLVGNDEWMLEYIGYYSKEQKEKHIKIIRGKVREQERREKRVINLLDKHKIYG
jgi:hypothetical protein